MASAKTILNQSRKELKKHVGKITYFLADYAEGDPHVAGEHALLNVQRQHLALVETFLAQAEDTARLSDIIHGHLIATHEAHLLAANHDHFNHPDPPGSHSDAWWTTLSTKDFLCHLLTELNHADDMSKKASKNGNHNTR